MTRQAQVLVVSGFLGSGKTTLVRHLLEEGQRDGIRTAVVSNEFGELGIDEALLASADGDFVELSGGCVCCRLSDDLLKTLQQLWERTHPERVVVECSGIALPYDTLINFWRDPVREWATDESSVVVVSAEQVAAGRDLDHTFEDQVCSADLLVLSKVDLVGEEGAERAEQLLRRMQPDVAIVRATYGNVDSRVFFPPEPGVRAVRAADAVHDHASHAHDDYVCEELTFAPGLADSEIQAALEKRASLRAKGFVRTRSGLRLVQGVAGRIELTTPASPPPEAIVGRVVVIDRARTTAPVRGPGISTDSLKRGSQS
ncbi:MAG TPA: GTP-binding protein [Candidatus Limnocylindrales bacterium]|nr:GTP-binding protein [Candidatus Limnocylindrales bacterium]